MVYIMRIHLVLYSNSEPLNKINKRTIDSIYNCTQHKIIIHDFNLEKIKQKEWFKYIKELPSIHRNNRRDEYYKSWKPFITKDVYDEMEENDILYYVDNYSYFKTGFSENIDKLCNIANEKLRIAGSVGDDIKNNTLHYCDNLVIWDKIIPYKNNIENINKLHILNSWFLFKKCKSNNNFINEWAYYSSYKDTYIIYPLVSYHHTGDQSIFNILVFKYNFPVFYHKQISHNTNKNKNLVLNIINNTLEPNNYFIYL
jgi:hypothetical protein